MSDLNTLIQQHWSAKAALDAAKQAEAAARQALSDFLCKDVDGLKNSTTNLSGGWKMRHEVARTLRANKSSEVYRALPTLLTPDQLNAVIRKKETLEFSYSAFNKLPDDVKAAIADAFSVNEAVTVKYDAPVDNR